MECNRCDKETKYNSGGLCDDCFKEIMDKNGKTYHNTEVAKKLDDLEKRVKKLEKEKISDHQIVIESQEDI